MILLTPHIYGELARAQYAGRFTLDLVNSWMVDCLWTGKLETLSPSLCRVASNTVSLWQVTLR